ncbi:MAG TPA: PAS domain-containing sensor histidine kinase [Candidatus Thermoplasmatota archaeon]|nr:PAS domain-containing sensor histidine kinase [Candidatus Thermoplasmatota archaeon]
MVASTFHPPAKAGGTDLVDDAPVMLWATDAQGEVTFVNRTWREFTGHHDARSAWRACIHPDDLGRYDEVSARHRAKRQPYQAEWRMRRQDGAYRWLLETARPRHAADGTFAGFVGCLVDVTDRHQLEERLREADRSRGMFINAASHELRTPLTPLLMQLHLLRTRPDLPPEKVREGLAIALRSAERLNELITDLLDVARLQKAGLAISARPTDLAPILDEVVRAFTVPGTIKGVRLVREGAAPLPMMGDERRLAQVVGNLVSNAIRFTSRGGTIRVRGVSEPEAVGVDVVDDGAGIAQDRLADLFKPFSQVHKAALDSGSGLGLFICRTVVLSHGGTISAHSDGPGKGATFRVRFPTAPYAQPEPQAPGSIG